MLRDFFAAAEQPIVIRHLRFFIAAAEEEHFERAAARLNIAQSALSRRIKDLEAELGVDLFERLPRGVRLSPVGRQFFEDTGRMARDFQLACERAQRLARGEEGMLRVGFNEIAVRAHAVSTALHRFRIKYPKIALDLRPLPSQRQIELLQSGELNVAFVYHFPQDQADLRHIDVETHSYLLAMPLDHRLAHRKAIRLADLAEERFAWIPRSQAARMYDQLMEECLAKGLSPNIACSARNGEDILAFASLGTAIGFVNSEVGRHSYKRVVMKPLADLDIPLHLSMAWRASDMSGVLNALIEVVSAASEAPQ